MKIFNLAGFDIDIPERRYFLKIDNPGIDCFLRPQEIPKYVEKENWMREFLVKIGFWKSRKSD